MHSLPTGVITASFPSHIDLMAGQQIHLIPNFASVTNSFIYISLSLYQMSFKRSSLSASTTYALQSTAHSCDTTQNTNDMVLVGTPCLL